MISGARYHRVATYPVISASVGRARPKSSIFRSQSSFTARLEGLRSLPRRTFSLEERRARAVPVNYSSGVNVLEAPHYLVDDELHLVVSQLLDLDDVIQV